MSVLGKLIYKFYHQPRGRREIIKKFGGEASYNLMVEGELGMKKYALNELILDKKVSRNGLIKLNNLTGEKFIHQSLFCIQSFFKHLTEEEASRFSVHFYDDGSLTPETKQILAERFSSIHLISYEKSIGFTHKNIPEEKYPFIYKKLRDYPQIKKLIFLHGDNTGMNTCIDSDMLFMKKPQQYLNWIFDNWNKPDKTFCILDIYRSYGYSDDIINEIWPSGVKNNINVGLYALDSKLIDIDLMEHLIKCFEAKPGSSYYIEQLITGIFLEKQQLEIAPREEYIVYPTTEQVLSQAGILQHYVDASKEWYFKEAWKKFI